MLELLSFTPIVVLLSILLYAKQTNKNLLKSYVSNYMSFAGCWFFAGHMFAPDAVAKSIGWPPGNPFQKEVAFANLSFSIAAIYVSNTTDDIAAYKAITVAYAAWLIGTLIVHIQDIIKTKNYAINNAVAAPLIAIITIIISLRLIQDEN